MRAQPGDQRGTVDAGQQDVYQEHVGLQLAGHGQADEAVFRHMQVHVWEVVGHQQAYQVLKMRGILNQQNARATQRRRIGIFAGAGGLGCAGSGCRLGRHGGRCSRLALAVFQPLLNRGARDAAMAAGRLPSLKLATIHHELHRTHGQPECLRHVARTALFGEGVEQICFHCGQIVSIKEKI